MGYTRNILGVPDKTSHLAVLVRLGVMPLNYMLAYRSAIWYLKLIRGLCGPALRNLYFQFLQDDDTYGSTNFFKPARDFVRRLNKYCAHVDFESCPIADAKRFLERAIYEELTLQWTQYAITSKGGSHTCHDIHPIWRPLRWQREMKSKLTCSWYHSVAVGRGRFRSRFFSYGIVSSPTCRFCHSEDETVDHILFSCPKLSENQEILRRSCKTLKLEFSLMNLFTKPQLQQKVESFLYEVFKDSIDEPNKDNICDNFSF